MSYGFRWWPAAGNDTTTFVYDADGQRVRTQVGGPTGTTTYFDAGGSQYEVVGNQPGTFTHYYSVGGETVAFSDDGNLTWMWRDYVNSTSMTRDENNVKKIQRYTPWGELRTDQGLATNHHYTGQISDQTTGLAYYNARYYDPEVARFISPDTIIPNPGNGQDYNRYSYVGNNPIRWNDPTGRCFDVCPPAFTTDIDENGQPTVSGDPATIEDAIDNGKLPDTLDCGSYAGGYHWRCSIAVPAGPNGSLTSWLLFAGGFVPVVGEGIDIHECGSGAGVNFSTGFDCGSFFIPFLGSRTDDAAGAVWRWLRKNDVPAPGSTLIKACKSFSADTEVLMADGTTTPISNIEVGDEVWAADPETGEAGNRTVTAVWPHQDWLLDFTVEGGSVTTTEDHHFWNATDHEWQQTRHIDQGDYLLAPDGQFLQAGNLDWATAHYATAFDLTVDELHTYFVVTGNDQVLVHNTDCGFDELGGLASYYDRSDLIDEIVEHTSGQAGRPSRSQIDDALSTTGERIRDGIPGRDNAVEFVNDGVVVIVNEDKPWLSTAFFD